MTILPFSKKHPTREELETELNELRQALAQLDAREPANPDSEAFEAWCDEHEDLEDQIDDILDLLDS